MINDNLKIKALENLLKKGKKIRFKTSGRSMLPDIVDGDLAIGITSKNIMPGDLVVFKDIVEGKPPLTLHRCIIPLNKKILTKGDNFRKFDGWIPRKKILCKVIKVNNTNTSTFRYKIKSFSKIIWRFYLKKVPIFKIYWFPPKDLLAKKYNIKLNNKFLYLYYIRNWFRQIAKIRFFFYNLINFIRIKLIKKIIKNKFHSKNNSNLEIFFFDVSHGDSFLIRLNNKSMLIDCGDSLQGGKVLSNLNYLEIKKLDYLIITHFHYDHSGGCKDILKNIKINDILVCDKKEDNSQFDNKSYSLIMNNKEKIIIPKINDVFSFDDASFKILNNGSKKSNLHENSMVFKFSFKNINILFTSDCDNEELLLDKDIKSDILKVAHHCGKKGLSDEFLKKVNPKIAVISVGPEEGYPKKEGLNQLKKHKIPVYRTDFHGNIIITSNGKSISIKKRCFLD